MHLIKKASELSGLSVRTLHHYDDIGLLSPTKLDNGYWYYSDEDMSVLQAILFYRFLGFSLKEIRDLLQEDEDLLPHLKKQLILMNDEKNRLLRLIETLEKTIESKEKEMNMSTKEKFKGFVYKDHEKYTEQAKHKYGKEVVEKSLRRQQGKEELLTEGFNQLFFAFSDHMKQGKEARSEDNVSLAKSLHEHICTYSFDCSLEVFSGIGYGYAQDPEFKKNIDQFGEGTAEYVCDAIQHYVKDQR